MLRLACVCFAFGLLLTGCSRLEPPETSGELVVAVRADPVFYEPAAAGAPAGFEHDLVAAFAADLKVKPRFVAVRDIGEMRELLRKGEVHLAAAFPVDTAGDLRFTAALHAASPLIVQHADAVPRDSADDLATQTTEVLRNSVLVPTLRARNPAALITEVDAANDVDLLARVNEGRAALVATDSVHFDVAVNYYPDLVVAQELTGKISYAWAFPAEADALRGKADAFIERMRADGTLSRLRDRYYGHIKRVGPNNMAQFLQLMQTRLPHYRAAFHQAQLLTGLDWRLLAALAYQESNWDPLATSPTGVRGMMMLTEDTADFLRVTNRLEPVQSILAGARYLATLMEGVPKEAQLPDRLWLALSAYNIGPGHFNGAVAIARGLNRDPTSWYEMKRVLPLLMRPQYYERLKSGRARGGEAVIMVENIRNFYSVLSRFEPAYVPVVTPR
jgi:membrane-bound lytic murein transglycosylase F